MENDKFFEMIYHSGPEDFESDFYKENNQKTRKHFFEQMLKDAKLDLENYKADPANQDLNNLLLRYYQEPIEALLKMKSEFIKNGRADVSSYIGLGVIERTLKTI